MSGLEVLEWIAENLIAMPIGAEGVGGYFSKSATFSGTHFLPLVTDSRPLITSLAPADRQEIGLMRETPMKRCGI